MGKAEEVELENWTAEIEKTELVSAEQLVAKLKQNSKYELNNPRADFYYLVTLKNIKWNGLSMAGKRLKPDDTNFLGSPYSPKVFDASGGKNAPV